MRKERSLSGMTAVVTGATAGIGLETVECLARQGVQILAVGRDPKRCREAERLVRLITPNVRLSYLVADLSLQSEVRRLAAEIVRALDDSGHHGLDLLLNVAGTFSTGRLSSEGIELTLAVNHLAPLLLSYQLLPRLQQARGRIFTVSSASHRRTWLRPEYLNQDCLLHGLWAYTVSKLANLLTSAEFNRRFASSGVRMLCLDPGLVNTDIGCKRTSFLERFIWNRRKRYGISPEVPARSLLQLATLDILPPSEAFYWRGERPIAPSDKVHNHPLTLSVWRESCSLCGITSGTGVGDMEQSVSVEDRILLATIECIELYGVRGATNRRIAAQAGVNVAAMNYYFRSKEALIQRVMALTIDNAFRYEDFTDFPAGSARERCTAIFDHLMTGGCTYPGLTRAHFTDLLSTGNYESQVVMGMNQFVADLAQDMARLGCALPPDELQLACMQITSAAMFIILAPRLFEARFGFSACDAAMRAQFLNRLIERLL